MAIQRYLACCFACCAILVSTAVGVRASTDLSAEMPWGSGGMQAETGALRSSRRLQSLKLGAGDAAGIAAAAASAVAAATPDQQAAYDKEHAALLAFKATMPNLDNTTWAALKWDAATNHCLDWLGVVCAPPGDAAGSVVVLNLTSSGLYGTFPWAPIGELSQLRVLFVDGNPGLAPTPLDPSLPAKAPHIEQIWIALSPFVGPIPETWHWENLTALVAFFSPLDGPIPASFGLNSKLQFLDLSGCKLETPTGGWGPLAGLKALQLAFMDQNRFTGPLSLPFANWTQLTNIVLALNQFTGSVPTTLGACTQLVEINLLGNKLTGSLAPAVKDWASLRNLKDLSLSRNPFDSEEIPAEIGAITSLQRLWLAQTGRIGQLPAGLCRLTNLTLLDLSGNNLVGPLCAELAGATGLKTLMLNDNKFSGGLPASWRQLTALTTLRLDRNCLRGPVPCSWGSVFASRAANLRVCYNPKSADACGSSGATLYGCLPFDGTEDADSTAARTTVTCLAYDVAQGQPEPRIPWNTGTAMSGFCGGEAFSLSAPPADLGTCCRTLPTNSTCGLQYNPANCSGTPPAQLLGFYGQGPAVGFMSTAYPPTNSTSCSDGARMGFFQTSCGTAAAAAARSATARRSSAKAKIAAEAVHFNLTTYTAQSVNRIRYYVGCQPPIAPPATAPNGGVCSQWRPLPARYTRTTSRNGTFAYTTWSHSLAGLDCGCSAAYTSIYIKSGTTCRP